jgi:hypothetical protein
MKSLMGSDGLSVSGGQSLGERLRKNGGSLLFMLLPTRTLDMDATWQELPRTVEASNILSVKSPHLFREVTRQPKCLEAQPFYREIRSRVGKTGASQGSFVCIHLGSRDGVRQAEADQKNRKMETALPQISSHFVFVNENVSTFSFNVICFSLNEF